jgi:hypothetical protein
MVRVGGIGNQSRRIAGPTRTDLRGKLTTSDLPDGGHQLAD